MVPAIVIRVVFSALRIAARAAEAGLENFPLHGCVKRLIKLQQKATYAALTLFASAAVYAIQMVALKYALNLRAPCGG